MGEYRRFVSYLYEYRNEKKEKIAGAVRVDCRGVRTQIRDRCGAKAGAPDRRCCWDTEFQSSRWEWFCEMRAPEARAICGGKKAGSRSSLCTLGWRFAMRTALLPAHLLG